MTTETPTNGQESEAAIARFRDQLVVKLPEDLYIPPEALEVFLEAFRCMPARAQTRSHAVDDECGDDRQIEHFRPSPRLRNDECVAPVAGVS